MKTKNVMIQQQNPQDATAVYVTPFYDLRKVHCNLKFPLTMSDDSRKLPKHAVE